MSTTRREWTLPTPLGICIAIILAGAGQALLTRHDLRGLIPYTLAVLILVNTLRHDKQRDQTTNKQADASHLSSPQPVPSSQPWYRRLMLLSLLLLALTNAILAFLSASGNTYRWYGVLAWILAALLFLIVFWERDSDRALWHKLDLSRDGWRMRWTTMAVIGLLLIGFFFRFWKLDEMPSEMTSDHIEKLLDIHDLVTGQRPIFFVRNTGREPGQFYWTLMFIRLLDLDTKFFALKLGTAVIGLITLPGIYLLGRDLFGRWVGFWAMFFTAVASWSVILSRVGLRFAFAPAATAYSLLFLLRGLRDGRRNDFLLLGVCLGIGLQGYTAFRAMPLAVIVCWGLAFVLKPSSLSIRRSSLLRNALLTVLIALVVFIPLGRFSLEHPEAFWQRSFSRLADPNHPALDNPLITLSKNLVNLALMFQWKGDEVWVNTLVGAPLLDPLLGGLLVLGLVTAIWHGARLRDPLPPLLLIAGAILLLPSALSLAYPMENPSAVRTGGAIPAIMVIAALPVGLAIERGSRNGQAGWRLASARGAVKHAWPSWLLVLGALGLAVGVTAINYRRYFVDYWKQYQNNALNTTEIASAVCGFVETGGDPANAWLIAWPYWIDTRGVGIELGDPPWNNVILTPQELDAHAEPQPEGPALKDRRPRFYVLHPEDSQSLEQLRSLFPDGWSSLYISKQPGRSFVLYFVPRVPLSGLMHDPGGMHANAS
jgi:hypothetical protein